MTIIQSAKPVTVHGCARCGRGQYDPKSAKLAIPKDKEQALIQLTRLIVVPCTMSLNHQVGDPHLLKCTGNLYVHAEERICGAVQKNALRT